MTPDTYSAEVFVMAKALVMADAANHNGWPTDKEIARLIVVALREQGYFVVAEAHADTARPSFELREALERCVKEWDALEGVTFARTNPVHIGTAMADAKALLRETTPQPISPSDSPARPDEWTQHYNENARILGLPARPVEPRYAIENGTVRYRNAPPDTARPVEPPDTLHAAFEQVGLLQEANATIARLTEALERIHRAHGPSIDPQRPDEGPVCVCGAALASQPDIARPVEPPLSDVVRSLKAEADRANHNMLVTAGLLASKDATIARLSEALEKAVVQLQRNRFVNRDLVEQLRVALASQPDIAAVPTITDDYDVVWEQPDIAARPEPDHSDWPDSCPTCRRWFGVDTRPNIAAGAPTEHHKADAEHFLDWDAKQAGAPTE